MRGVLIDPETRTITEVSNLGGWPMPDILAALTYCPDRQVEEVESVRLGFRRGNDLILIDAGVFADREARAQTWSWGGFGRVLAGRGLLIGRDDDGRTVGARASDGEIRAHIRWVDGETTGESTQPHYVGARYRPGGPILQPSSLGARVWRWGQENPLMLGAAPAWNGIGRPPRELIELYQQRRS